ncbi:MAG: YraN family protein [Patescibacteria group bacterium]
MFHVANPIARLGENQATLYLQKKGYKILERNFKARYGEIDIIATHKDTLVFVEVKTRTSNEFGTPFEAITPWKLKAVVRTAQFYELTHKKLPEALRIDAVAVLLNSDGKVDSIEHMENISGF